MSPTRVRIKICGITSPALAAAAADAGADAVGVVLAPESPRRLRLPEALEVAASLAGRLPVVAVLAGLPENETAAIAASWPGPVQIHGSESLEWVASLPRPVWRGLPWNRAAAEAWAACPRVSALVVDGQVPGSGTAPDLAGLAEALPALGRPVILAGGLEPGSVGGAIRAHRPYGVDVSSGVERSRGVKDAGLIRAFCDAVRAAERGASAA